MIPGAGEGEDILSNEKVSKLLKKITMGMA